MRFTSSISRALMLTLLLAGPSWARDRGAGQGSISGALIGSDGDFLCQNCEVRLEVQTGRLIDTTYPDLMGRFTFLNVPQGSYIIRVEIDGFPAAEQRFEMRSDDAPATANIIVNKPVTPDPRVEKNSGSYVADISQFMHPKKAVDVYNKAMGNSKKGKKEEAIRQLEESIRIAPDFCQAYADLGALYWQAGRVEDAERALLRAHELNARNADPLVWLSGLYADTNRPERAVTMAEEAIRTNPRSGAAFHYLGMALYQLSMLDRAEAALKKAFGLAPKMGQVRLVLANVYLKQGRYGDMLDQLDRYLAENPDGKDLPAAEETRRKLQKAMEAKK